MARSIHPVVVGTAGHIDHGKSSLVKALTGIDPDRLKEEQERGLTIDLGFARLKLSDGRWLGLIDVPGHERFVRNMVAGCTGLDLAMLVVAADDGVMPQTIEHVDIIDLLSVRGGLIVLTKIDMVEPALVDMAEQEVRQLVAGTALAGAKVMRTSSRTGEGIPELKAELEALATGIAPRTSAGPFRMPIQRVFSLPGIGTVITGVPLSGTLQPGAEVEILPGRQRIKVRGLHAYGGKVDEAMAGHSTALSVPDAREAGVHRGMVAAEPDAFAIGDALDVELTLTKRSPQLAHRAPIRCHTGTIEVRGNLLLLDRDRAGPGDVLVARLELDEELCCAHNDRFLLRLQNPAVTVGGGRVLRLSQTGRYRRRDLGAELQGLVAAGERPEARLRHELTQAGAEGRPVDELARALGCTDTETFDALAGMPDVELHRRGMRAFLREHIVVGEQELLQSVDRMLHKRPAAASIARSALRTTKTLPQPLIELLFDRLQAAGRVRSGRRGQVLFLDRLKALPPAEQQALDRLVAFCEERGFRPPELAELEPVAGRRGDALLSLLDRAQDEGRIDKVAEHFYGASIVRKVLRAVRGNCLRHAEVLDIPTLRDELDTSRKFLIPLLEYVDALGLTVLRGGVRRLLPSSDLNRELAASSD
ncbi:MAG: selenocysteine-specific translation elongation factor [Planctomycetes bacterium]|jgi:selenocysteine-specific elongation factor|nr:selenocysteine-specific translation elongation factor [Planctomycetota bacterium]